MSPTIPIETPLMLALETADENLYVPESEVASLTPVYPDPTRVVLADGTVGHFPGPPPLGPWVPLHDSWVTPHLLTREGDFWKDPADYRIPTFRWPTWRSRGKRPILPRA